MLWYYAPLLLTLLHPTFCFPRGKVTEKPEIPIMVNPKQRKPTHISDFTDPGTGLNPFLDIEEGRTSIGRNVMEDERGREEVPPSYYFETDLVEGDAPDRKWSFEEDEPKEGHAPGRGPSSSSRWPELDYLGEKDFPLHTTRAPVPMPPTTVIAKDHKEVELGKVLEEDVEPIRPNNGVVEKESSPSSSFEASQSTVIYATASISVVAAITLLVGACWWRRKLKTPTRSATSAESGEVKS